MSETKIARHVMGRLAQILEEEISQAMATATRAACGRVLLELAKEEGTAPRLAPDPIAIAVIRPMVEEIEAAYGAAPELEPEPSEAAEPEPEPPVAAESEPEPEQVPTKVCRRCGEEKPLTEYYLSTGHRGGRRAVCKACTEENRARRRSRLAEQDPAYGSGLSTFLKDHHVGEGECPRCGETGHLYRPDGDESADVMCYACLQKEKNPDRPGCVVCGALTPPKKRGRGYRKYCSRKCEMTAFRERRAAEAQGGEE